MSTIWLRESVAQRDKWNVLFESIDAAVSDLDYVRSPTGGIIRMDVLEALRPRLHELGFSGPGDTPVQVAALTESGGGSIEVDAMHEDMRIALIALGGRAHTNNEALVSTLLFAAAENVEAGILVLPHQYKGSSCAANVRRRLHDLASWKGVSLDLLAVHVASY